MHTFVCTATVFPVEILNNDGKGGQVGYSQDKEGCELIGVEENSQFRTDFVFKSLSSCDP